jgi:hypothetical protein
VKVQGSGEHDEEDDERDYSEVVAIYTYTKITVIQMALELQPIYQGYPTVNTI